MATRNGGGGPGDPFSDQAAIVEDPKHSRSEQSRERELVAEATLPAGRNATLTLGTDTLIVLGS